MNKSDVLIIGGGISGLVAAKKLTSEGIKVTLIDRKTKNHSKKFYSRLLSYKHLSDIFPEILKKQNDFLERNICDLSGYVIKDDSILSLNNKTSKADVHSVMWSSFLNELVSDLEKSGVDFVFEENVHSLLKVDEKFIGLQTNKNQYYSDYMILAEGVESTLAKKYGLRKGEIPKEQLFLFNEEIYSMHKESFASKFNLKNAEGFASKFYFSFADLKEIKGVGYLYSNSSGIVLGAGVLLSDLIENEININDVLNRLKSLDFISNTLVSCTFQTTLSYTMPAQLRTKHLPLPILQANNCVLAGSVSTLINPFSYSQVPYLALTGRLAAESIIYAKRSGLVDLSWYNHLISENEEIKNLRGLGENTSPGIIETGLYFKKKNDEVLDGLKELVFKE